MGGRDIDYATAGYGGAVWGEGGRYMTMLLLAMGLLQRCGREGYKYAGL